MPTGGWNSTQESLGEQAEISSYQILKNLAQLYLDSSRAIALGCVHKLQKQQSY